MGKATQAKKRSKHSRAKKRSKQSRVKKPQSRAKKPQSRAKQSKRPKQSQAKEPQSRAKEPQSRAEAPQSRPRRGRGLSQVMLNHMRRGEAERVAQNVKKAGKDLCEACNPYFPQGLGQACNPYSEGWGYEGSPNGWRTCVNFLSKDYTEMCDTARNSLQLIQINACSALMHGVQADVNWYIGGNSYVELPAAVAAVRPGVYLAMTTWFRMGPNFPEEDAGPEAPVASINHLRWLGTANKFLEMVRASRNTLGKKHYDRLVEMLTFYCDSQSDGGTE
jgi:hypothetical protein